MEIPASMTDELEAYHGGEGISLDHWITLVGNYRHALGYLSLFWPQFVFFEKYILLEGFKEQSVRDIEASKGATPKSVEWGLNHQHLDLYFWDKKDISSDKLVLLGNTLQEMYQAKLRWQFPDRPCIVEFSQPDDPDHFEAYEVSFWQEKHDDLSR
jgi:hypothetical protein